MLRPMPDLLRYFDVARSLHAPTINIRYLLEV